ncbi:MAG: SpoIIE family protein phosphatase [Rhodoferax sp.]|uniref:ATP-binding SpoIIE family protein phosphatase n=1 Tax=Rhodoferax sp. TaxID=50421 RepID=UPI0030174E3D
MSSLAADPLSEGVLRILLVDDEPLARLILSRPLVEMGYHITMAVSGNDALQILENNNFDLILLDIGMQDGDGYMVLESLRRSEAVRWVPVIVTSGHQSEAQIMRALELGADDYMTKPLNIGFLRYKIRNFQRVISLQNLNLKLLDSVLHKQQLLEERIALEFEYSARIQKTLLFGSIPLAPGGVFTSARAQAAQGINGDFIEIISVYSDSVDIIIGDVMGKGPLAAILGADVKLQVQRQISNRLTTHNAERFSVGEIVNAIHRTLTPKLIELESFVTFLYARLDKAAGTLTVVCCGHPPLIVLNGGQTRLFGSPNLPLGVLAEELYIEQQCDIAAGAAVICYSDGLSEAKNSQGEAYGEDRLMQELAPYHQSPWGANALVEMVYASVLRFIGDQALTDDLTLVVAKVPDAGILPHRLRLARQLCHIAELRGFIGDFAREQKLTEDLADKITLVTVEAFTNTVRHSSSEIINSSIEVQISHLDGTVWVLLEALGPYFDPVRESLLLEEPFDLNREGGFGLHIINALADTFNYSHTAGVNRMGFGFYTLPR